MAESGGAGIMQPPPPPYDPHRVPFSSTQNNNVFHALTDALSMQQIQPPHSSFLVGSIVSAGGGDGTSNSDEEDDDESGSESTGNGSKKTRRIGFIDNLYEMVHAPDHELAIGFTPDGLSLEVRNTSVFSSNVLAKHFKHRNVSSFIRQLNNYGFRTIPSNKGVFQTFIHDNFQRDRRDLIRFITRRTNAVVKKKKTLFEQVSELKQRDVERRQRLEELETTDAQKTHYIGELETRNRMLLEERESILIENKRLMVILGSGGSPNDIPLHTHQQVHHPHHQLPPPPRQPSNSHPHYHPQQQRQQQHARQQQQQHYQQQRSPRHHIPSQNVAPSTGHHHAIGSVVSVGNGWAPPPPSSSHHHHQQQQQQSISPTLFEPVSGPSRYEPGYHSNSGGSHGFGSSPTGAHGGEIMNDWFSRLG